MSNNPKLTNFVSEMDQFLQAFDKSHADLSLSQRKEVEKYQRIYRLRDESDRLPTSDKLWEGF